MKKYFILILTIILNINLSQSQENKYADLWEKVDELEKQGLTKSALEAVQKIKAEASKNKDVNQKIKTLIYASKYALVLEEDAQLKIINDFRTEIAQSAFPEKNILESLLANLFWQYFQQNRWQFYNRTNTAEKVDKNDFRTWDLQTIFEEIDIHFKNSIENGLLAQQEDIENYYPLLNVYGNSKKISPTLYDFLLRKALSFYQTDENNITKPAYKFEIDDLKYLGTLNTFVGLTLKAKDTASLELKALNIYQDLINFHLTSNNQYALANADIERINYVYKNATFTGKDDILLKTLSDSKNYFKDQEVASLYDFEIAHLYYTQGNTYDSKTNKEMQWKHKDALEICEKIIADFPNSPVAYKATSLKFSIQQNELNITVESFLPINKPSRILLSYRNLNELSFQAFPLSKSRLEEFQKLYNENDKLKFVNKLNVEKQWTAILKNENDYQLHTTEVKLPELKNGHYLILSTTTNSKDDEIYGFGITQITNIVAIQKTRNEFSILQFLDRNNGKPLAAISIKITYRDYQKNKDVSKDFITDSNGEIKIGTSDSTRYYDLTILATNKDEKAYFGPYYIYDRNGREQYVGTELFLFTDRSIYRPGQTVYFKGIMVSKMGDKSEVIANSTISLNLSDPNSQEVKNASFVTNEYGSFHGEFIVPETGLTGIYTLSSYYYGSTNFSVEEYKRPKFETKFEPVKETYKVNDSIVLNGVATAYAGSAITDAKVVYRVHRKVQYPRWCYWYWPYLSSESQEIIHGESITNNKGEYKIKFQAQPDNSVDKALLPVFNYEITADVTDINGETRSTTTIVNVGYHALTVTMDVPEKLDKDRKDYKISISSKNLNGEFVPADGVIKIYKIKAPKNALRSRPWNAPDYSLFSEDEFKSLFPHESYQGEDDPKNWEKGELVFTTNFNTGKDKEITLNKFKKWETGKYIVELESKDKFGQLVKDIKYTEVFDFLDNKVPDNQLFFIAKNKDSYKVGDEVIIKFGSASSDITVNLEIEKKGKIISSRLVHLSNNCDEIRIPVKDEDLGGFGIIYSYTNFNSFKSGTIIIPVPYPPTDLKIEAKTFRDKLLPGQDETWSFTIKGPEGNKVAAEMLASMYDASLDQFKSHDWYFDPFYRPDYYVNNNIIANNSFGNNSFTFYRSLYRSIYSFSQYYQEYNWFGFYFGENYRYRRMYKSARKESVPSAAPMELNAEADGAMLEEVATVGYAEDEKKEERSENDADSSQNKPKDKATSEDFEGVQIRTNLQETAFFFPQLKTDTEGNVSFNFTTPEALTQWKLQLLAHTKTLESATKTFTTVTQKELMVVPNAPRFLREGDKITISSKISNLTDKVLTGQAVLQLFDAVSGNAIDNKLSNSDSNKNFSVDAKGNTNISWTLQIPYDVQAVQYKVIAKAGEFSDGEQNALPVLSNRMLVTETMPMWIRSNQTRTFTLDKLKNNTSTTLKNHQLTLEMTSNPAWYAVQALPYLMEYPYECYEQTFSRYYANSLASHIANSNPRIKEVFDQWKGTNALLSNLEKNQELKSILIQETPWVRDAQSETEQKKRIALLFDINKMSNELQRARQKLRLGQLGNGAWSWFEGGRPSRFITQHIVAGFGHLKHLKVNNNDDMMDMVKNALPYLDREFVNEYDQMKKYTKNLNDDHLSYSQIHYLYMRSFFMDIPQSKRAQEVTEYYKKQAQKYWLDKSLYAKGMLALILNRMDDNTTAVKIIKSLKENSITSDEMGMYWKENTASWYWYQAPIETQALMIEAFSEIDKDVIIIDNLKIWLLKNKQTNKWETTKATTEAVYALLLQGNDWLSVTEMVDITIGDKKIDPSKMENVKVEAGTGYFKTSWSGNEITQKMADVTIAKKGDGIAWGGLYWQYFEDLDKITHAETPLKLSKKLFLKSNTDTGEKITAITDKIKLNVGDLIRVRIELKVDREMEFVHMKDMRASGLEPINVLSQYKWQDGLGYYESTKDASTNFFFDYLPKGVHVFEYDLRVNNAGDFSNGITTIQSMYAPEFTSHSEGVRISIEE